MNSKSPGHGSGLLVYEVIGRMFTPKAYKISKARLMIYNSNLVPQKYRFMAPIHPKMAEYELWSGWYKQVMWHA
jgi:hypothetical protein